MEELTLEVIVAARETGRTLRNCLAALDEQCLGDATVVRVVGSIAAVRRSELAEIFPRVLFDEAPADALVPELWGRGIERSRAAWVALTIAQCVVGAGWLATIREQIRAAPDAAGFGGPIEPPEPRRGRDGAAFLVRYSAYWDMAAGEVSDLPGDNAVYRRTALAAAWNDREDGFWEALVNAEMQRRDERLVFVPAMTVRLGPLESAGVFCHQRYHHGRHYGSTRTLSSAGERWVRLAVAPLLVPVLAWRFWRRVPVVSRHRLPSPIRLLPWLGVFLAAWTAGEASGYLWRRGSP